MKYPPGHKVTRHKRSGCPRCGLPITASTSVEKVAAPEVGDFGICWRCGQILRYRDDLTVRAADPWELIDPKLLSSKSRAVMLLASERIREKNRSQN